MLIDPRKLLQALFALSAILIAGCTSASPAPQATDQQAAEKPQYGGMFNISTAQDPPTFDIQRESTFHTVRPMAPSYNNLIRYAPLDQDKLVPDLAERWDVSQDGKTVTFYLRKGVTFHNGDPFTSADAKFTIDRVRGAIKEGPGALATAPRKDLIRAIERVETPDDYTVVVRMQYPQASFFGFLANNLNAPIYSKKWIEAGHDPRKEVNGTGPFKIKQYISGTSTEVVKNDTYWDPGLPYLDGITVFIIPQASTEVAALRAGQVMYASVTPSAEESLQPAVAKGEVPLDLVVLPRGNTSTSLQMNTTRPPFNNPKLRKAVTLAVDREGMMKAGGSARSKVAGWLIAGSIWGLPPEELAKIPGYGKDKAAEREEAKRILAEAGYANGMSFKMTTRNTPDSALIWGDQLSKVGIKIEIEVLVDTVYDPLLAKGDFLMTNRGGTAGTTEDPDSFYGQFLACGSSRNYSQWCDPKFEELFSKQSQTLDPEARRKIVWELEKYVLEQAATLPPGYQTPPVWAVNNHVRGWMPHNSDYNHTRMDSAWLAK